MQNLNLIGSSRRFHIVKRTRLFAILFAFCICVPFSSPAFSAEKAKPSEIVSVFDFESERGKYKDTAAFLTDSIRNELAKTGGFKVMERSLMDSLLSKHSFLMTKDVTVEYAVEAGRALAVKTVITGYVSKKDDVYYVSLSRINVSTGTVEFIVEDKCSGEKEALTQLSKTALAKLLGVTKIAPVRSSGPENKRFSVGALSIVDETNGLAWLKDANSAENAMTWGEAGEYVKQLNVKKYAGSGDWRLPGKNELETIIEYARREGAQKNINELLSKIGFKNMKAEYYWSATSDEETAGLVWVIDLYSGTMSTAGKSGIFYVWPVRGTR